MYDKCDVLVKGYKRLSAIAHHGGGTAEGLDKIFTELKEALDILTAPQLAINEEMDGMLSRPPSDEAARRLAGMQPRWATQLRLAEVLPDEWLPYMKRAGYFSEPRPADPPRSTPTGPVGPGYFRWPPSMYLRRCAERRGGEVADIILGTELKDERRRNPAVYIDFLACACDLPLSDAEKVAFKALKEGWGDYISIMLLDERYLELAGKLYLGGRRRTAAEVLFSAMRSRLLEAPGAPPRDAAHAGPRQPAAPLDTMWLAHVLDEKVPPLAQDCPWPIIDMLGRLLDEVVSIGGQRPKRVESDDGISALLDCNSRWDDTAWVTVEEHIVRRTVDCIRECVPRTPEGMVRMREAMKTFYKKSPLAFRRIELAAYAEFPKEFKREIETAVVLYFDQKGTRNEHRNLLEAAFGICAEQTRREVLKKIDGGIGRVRFGLLAEEHGMDSALATEKHWKARHLHLIKDHLEEDRLATYSELLKEADEARRLEQALPAIKFQEMKGNGALAGKSADQAFEHIREYEKDVNEFFEGGTMGIEFEEYAKINSGECSKRAYEARLLGRGALRCLIAGLDAALREGSSVDWNGVLKLIEHMAGLPRTDARRSHSLVSAACSLVEKGLKVDSIGAKMKGRVWRILGDFVKMGTEYAEEEGGAAGPTYGSSLDASLNGIDGVSFHAVYQYAAWCKRLGGEGKALAPEAKHVFDSYLDRELGRHTAARHAVLGVFLPILYQLDRKWARSLPSRAATSREAKIAFWDAYVSWNHLYSYVFEDMRSWYHDFSKRNPVQGDSSGYLRGPTVAHIMLAHFYGMGGPASWWATCLAGTARACRSASARRAS